jgi:hypothetical protein
MDKKQNNGLFITLVVLVCLLSLISIFVAAGNKVDEKALADKVTAQVISKIPTPEKVNTTEIANEVAGLIQIPEAESVDNEKVNDLWEDLYSDEIDELETEAYDVAVEELEENDYKLIEKFLERNVEDFDELKDIDVEDYDVTIVKLGLEEDEDKCAVVEFEIKVRYTLNDGEATAYKKTLLVSANVLFDEGDFDDEDVEWEFPTLN